MFKNIDKFMHDFERRICEVLLLFIVGFVFIAAVLRWFKIPLIWSIDVAQLLFVWVCFLGGDVALESERHIGVDMLTRRMPKEIYRFILIGTYLLIIGFLILIAYYGIYLSIINYKRQFSSMEFSYSWATASAPVGCVLMIRTSIKKIYKLIINKEDKDILKNKEESTIY